MKSSTQYVSSSLMSVLVRKETSTQVPFNKTTSDTLPHENTYTYSNINTQPTLHAENIKNSLKSITTDKSIKQPLNFTKNNKSKLAYSKHSTNFNSNNSIIITYPNINNYSSTYDNNKTKNIKNSSKKINIYRNKISTTTYPFKKTSNVSLVYNKNITTFSPKSEKSLNNFYSEATSKNAYARKTTSQTNYTTANIFLNTELSPLSLETIKTPKKDIKNLFYLPHSISQTNFTTQTNIKPKNEKELIVEQFNISNKTKIIFNTSINPTALSRIKIKNNSKELKVVFKANKTVPKVLTEFTSLIPQNVQNSTSIPSLYSEFNAINSNTENLNTQIRFFPLMTTEKNTTISYDTTSRKFLPLNSTNKNVYKKLNETTKNTVSHPTTTKDLKEVENQSLSYTSTKAYQHTSLKHLLKNITGDISKFKNAYKNSVIDFSKVDKPNAVKIITNNTKKVLSTKSNNLSTNYIMRKKHNKNLTNTKVHLSLTEPMPIHKNNKTITYLELTTKPSTEAPVNNITTSTKKESNYYGTSATTMRADYYKNLVTNKVSFGISTLKKIENNNSTLSNGVKTIKNMFSTGVPTDNYFTVGPTDITGVTSYVSNRTSQSKVSKLIQLKDSNKVDTTEYNNLPKSNHTTVQYTNIQNIKLKEKISSQLIAPITTNETKDVKSVNKNKTNKNTLSQKTQEAIQKIVSLTTDSSSNASTKLKNLTTSANSYANLIENITYTPLEGNMFENNYHKEKTKTINIYDFNNTFDYTEAVTASNKNDNFTNSNESISKYSTVTDTLLLAENLELKLSSTKNKTSTTASVKETDFQDSTRILTDSSFTDITLTENLKKLPLSITEVSDVTYLSKNIEPTTSSGIKNSASITKIHLPTVSTKVTKKKTNQLSDKKITTHHKITNTNDGKTTKFDLNHTIRSIITHESLNKQDFSGYSSGFEFKLNKQVKKLNFEKNGGESLKTTQINKDRFLHGNISQSTNNSILLHKNESYMSNITLKTYLTKVPNLYLPDVIKNTSSKQFNFYKNSENLYNKSILKNGFVKDALKTSKLDKVPENIKQFYKNLNLKQKLELFEIMLDDILLHKIVEENQELYHNKIKSYLNTNTTDFNTTKPEKNNHEQVNPVPAPLVKYISNKDVKVLEHYNTYSLKEKNNGNKNHLSEHKRTSRPVYIRVTGTIALETNQTSLDSNFSLVGVTLLRDNTEKIRPKVLQQSDIVIELESYKKHMKFLEETKIRKFNNETNCFCKQLRTENEANEFFKFNINTTKNVEVLTESGSGYYSSSGEESLIKSKVR